MKALKAVGIVLVVAVVVAQGVFDFMAIREMRTAKADFKDKLHDQSRASYRYEQFNDNAVRSIRCDVSMLRVNLNEVRKAVNLPYQVYTNTSPSKVSQTNALRRLPPPDVLRMLNRDASGQPLK